MHFRKGMCLKRDAKLSATYVIRNFLYIFNRDTETGENVAGLEYTSHIRYVSSPPPPIHSKFKACMNFHKYILH